MKNKQIIDTTKCRYNTFDGGNTQRTICTIDGCFCDCLREKECYYKQLKAKEKECAEWKHQAELGCETTNRLTKELEEKEKECEQLREIMHKDRCSHYVLGECSQNHHNNCVGRNQCIKDLEQECERWKSNFNGKVSAIEELIKQLDQLKAENEKLKKQLTILNDEDVVVEITVKQFEEYKKLKAENEELKDLNTRLDNQRETYWKEYQKLKAENEGLKEKINSLVCSENCYKYKQAEKYKATLQEIKEIAEWHTTKADSEDVQEDMKQILQKISEVEDE